VKDRKTRLSEDRKYRWTLWREWPMKDGEERQGNGDGRAYVMFIGLNPSTADETQDDPTIRRCIGFAKSWGFGTLCMTNLFAFRATSPKDLFAEPEPVGQLNDSYLENCARDACIVIAAWGKHGAYRKREADVAIRFACLDKFSGKQFQCLGRNRDGSPRHPLYLRKDTLRELFWRTTVDPCDSRKLNPH
jgi:hypothetical protein